MEDVCFVGFVLLYVLVRVFYKNDGICYLDFLYIEKIIVLEIDMLWGNVVY